MKQDMCIKRDKKKKTKHTYTTAERGSGITCMILSCLPYKVAHMKVIQFEDSIDKTVKKNAGNTVLFPVMCSLDHLLQYMADMVHKRVYVMPYDFDFDLPPGRAHSGCG